MRFFEASAVEAIGDGAWAGEVRPGWDVVGNAHGGYLMAIAARASCAASGRQGPVSITGHFMAPTAAGPVTVAPQVLKEGRRLSTVSAVLSTTRPTLAVLGSYGDDAVEAPALDRHDGAPPDLPPREECVRAEPTDTFPPPFVGRVDLRLAVDDTGFGSGSEPVIAGWAGLLDGEPVDEIAIVMLADAFPPAIFFAGGPLAWVPTVELTVQVRRRPVTGWLRCIFRTRFVTGGMLEEDGELWDEDGNLVALSRQLALVPQT